MSETPNNVVNMAEYRARKEVAEFNFPKAPQLGAEAWQDTIEATPAPSVEPVVESHDGRAYVRTVENHQITFNPHEEDYAPTNIELAPESQVIFKAALDIVKARKTMTVDMLSEPVSIVSNSAYLDMLSEQEKAAA